MNADEQSAAYAAWLAEEDRPATLTRDLAVPLGGSPDSFTGRLLELIAKADRVRTCRLLSAFPREVLTYLWWMTQEHVPTIGAVAEQVTFIENNIYVANAQHNPPQALAAALCDQFRIDLRQVKPL